MVFSRNGKRDGGGTGLAPGAAQRRVLAAAREWEQTRGRGASAADERPSVVIASGGRLWDGETEADAMAGALVRLGVPDAVIVRERLSFTTGENARFSAVACARRGIDRVSLVTCV